MHKVVVGLCAAVFLASSTVGVGVASAAPQDSERAPVAVQPASPEQQEHSASPEQRGEEMLTPPKRRNDGGVSAAASEGCFVRPFNPSIQYNYAVSAAETECYTNEPRLYVNSRIQRSRWYGWETRGEDPVTRYNTWYAYSSGDSYCLNTGTYNYRTKSSHEIQWYDGSTSSATRYSNDEPRLTC